MTKNKLGENQTNECTKLSKTKKNRLSRLLKQRDDEVQRLEALNHRSDIYLYG